MPQRRQHQTKSVETLTRQIEYHERGGNSDYLPGLYLEVAYRYLHGCDGYSHNLIRAKEFIRKIPESSKHHHEAQRLMGEYQLEREEYRDALENFITAFVAGNDAAVMQINSALQGLEQTGDLRLADRLKAWVCFAKHASQNEDFRQQWGNNELFPSLASTSHGEDVAIKLTALAIAFEKRREYAGGRSDIVHRETRNFLNGFAGNLFFISDGRIAFNPNHLLDPSIQVQKRFSNFFLQLMEQNQFHQDLNDLPDQFSSEGRHGGPKGQLALLRDHILQGISKAGYGHIAIDMLDVAKQYQLLNDKEWRNAIYELDSHFQGREFLDEHTQDRINKIKFDKAIQSAVAKVSGDPEQFKGDIDNAWAWFHKCNSGSLKKEMKQTITDLEAQHQAAQQGTQSRAETASQGSAGHRNSMFGSGEDSGAQQWQQVEGDGAEGTPQSESFTSDG